MPSAQPEQPKSILSLADLAESVALEATASEKVKLTANIYLKRYMSAKLESLKAVKNQIQD